MTTKKPFTVEHSLKLRPTAAPANPVSGQIYNDATLGILQWDETTSSWQSIASPVATSTVVGTTTSYTPVIKDSSITIPDSQSSYSPAIDDGIETIIVNPANPQTFVILDDVLTEIGRSFKIVNNTGIDNVIVAWGANTVLLADQGDTIYATIVGGSLGVMHSGSTPEAQPAVKGSVRSFSPNPANSVRLINNTNASTSINDRYTTYRFINLTEQRTFTVSTASQVGRVVYVDNTTNSFPVSIVPTGDLVNPGEVAGFKVIDGSTVVKLFSSDSDAGSGEVNLIADPSAATNWAVTGTAAVATTTLSAELPLEGAVDTALKISAGSATNYARYRFTMAESLKNTLLKIEWFQRTLSSYASGDFKVELYTNTASNYSGTYVEVPLSEDVSGDSFIPNANGNYKNTFVSNSLDYYELRIIRVSGASALALSNVIVGPGKTASGAIITEWQDYTPTFRNATGLTITTNIARYRRVGSVMEIDMRLGFSGTGTDAAFFGIDYPPGLSAVNSVLLNVSTSQVFGHGYFRDSSANTNTVYRITTQTFDPTVFVLYPPAGSSALFGNGIAASDAISFQARVPIAEWAGNGVVNVGENDVEYAFNTDLNLANDTTSFGYGPQGVVVPTGSIGVTFLKNVKFKSKILPTDTITLEVSRDRISWTQLDLEGAGGVISFTRQGAVEYGLGITPTNIADTVQARFGPYRIPGVTYAGAGSNWIGGTYWRLKKTRAGSATGFGVAQNGSTGLVQYNEVTLSGVSNQWTGGTVKISRVNNQVTLWFDGITHASLSGASSAIGFVPEEFRPSGNAINVYDIQPAVGLNALRRVTVGTTGQVTLNYINWSGAAISLNTAGSGTISWTI